MVENDLANRLVKKIKLEKENRGSEIYLFFWQRQSENWKLKVILIKIHDIIKIKKLK
jgi:hypothetical protein